MKSGAYMGPMVRLFTESAFKVNCKKSGNDTCVNLIIFCHDHSLYGDSDESHIEELRRKLKEEGYEIEKSWSTYKK
jgi:hypothetical protein